MIVSRENFRNQMFRCIDADDCNRVAAIFGISDGHSLGSYDLQADMLYDVVEGNRVLEELLSNLLPKLCIL